MNFVGRLTKDPDLRYTPNGNEVVEIIVAVSGAEGAPTTFYEVAVWDPSTWSKDSEWWHEAFSKGSRIAIEGSVKVEEWTNPRTGEIKKRNKVSAWAVYAAWERPKREE